MDDDDATETGPPPIADTVSDAQYQAMERPQTVAIPPAGTIMVAGVRLLYRIDRSQAWSYLHYRHSALAEPTGVFIKTTPAARRASEKRLVTPWGELMVLLWDLGPGLDLVAGREALGGPSPCPWRPFIFSDKPKVRPNPSNGPAAIAAPFVDESAGQQIGGRVIFFSGRSTR